MFGLSDFIPDFFINHSGLPVAFFGRIKTFGKKLPLGFPEKIIGLRQKRGRFRRNHGLHEGKIFKPDNGITGLFGFLLGPVRSFQQNTGRQSRGLHHGADRYGERGQNFFKAAFRLEQNEQSVPCVFRLFIIVNVKNNPCFPAANRQPPAQYFAYAF